MPRYFMHFHGGGDRILDGEGLLCADLDSARSAALVAARGVLSEEVMHGRLPLGHRIEVEDEAGSVVAIVTFAEAVGIVHSS